jgi:threonine synthase
LQFSFENVVLKGLANDGGLFIPEEIPSLPADWTSKWSKHSFQELAYEIFSLYIAEDEIPSQDLKKIIERSYTTFRRPEVTPTLTLDQHQNLYLLECFHGPTFAFKDVALQFLGNLFEYFLVRKNKGKEGRDRQRLTIIGATSGDTGSAAIYGMRGKKDISVFILHPYGKISDYQEAQMTTVLDDNVHNIAVDGSFDDCQDYVKALFGDSTINEQLHVAAVNSINWARILAQITYYFYSYLQLKNGGHLTADGDLRFVVPTGNFGDVLAGFFAKRMASKSAGDDLCSRLIIGTNENDILHRFWKTGAYEKQPPPSQSNGVPAEQLGQQSPTSGVKETLSPAMDILISSNFERLLWLLAQQHHHTSTNDVATSRRIASEAVREWQDQLRNKGGFRVDAPILEAARAEFSTERVSDEETVETIRAEYDRLKGDESKKNTVTSPILDPHTAVGVTAARRSIAALASPQQEQPARKKIVHVALATAHPAKFPKAVELALDDGQHLGFNFERDVLPEEFKGLLELPRRVTRVGADESWVVVRKIVMEKVERELEALYGKKEG